MVFLTNRTLTKVGQDRIWFADSQTGEEYVYPCDRVVLALGTTPTRPYALEDLQALGAKVFRVGDAAQSGQVWDAVHDGYHGRPEPVRLRLPAAVVYRRDMEI